VVCLRHPPRRPAPASRGLAACALLGGVLLGCARPEAPAAPPGQLLDEQVFSGYGGRSTTLELARRALTPLTFRQVERTSAAGQALKPYPVDLPGERFAVYLPAGPPPPGGYGLLVFIAPWAELTRPQRWRPPLDRHGLIFVSFANAGNEVPILDRRAPLAVLAAENVAARWPVDPARVYVMGFSGGSRAALVTALAYPDLFRGALLNAGADPIGGEQGIYPPPADLLARFQGSRLVLVSGDQDTETRESDRIAAASLREFCVADVQVDLLRRTGHTPLEPAPLDRALAALEHRASPDEAALARCRAGLAAALAAQVAEVEEALGRGLRASATARLRALDARFGGLGASEAVRLAERIEALPR
jgi:dienelactone hydrolase